MRLYSSSIMSQLQGEAIYAPDSLGGRECGRWEGSKEVGLGGKRERGEESKNREESEGGGRGIRRKERKRVVRRTRRRCILGVHSAAKGPARPSGLVTKTTQ